MPMIDPHDLLTHQDRIDRLYEAAAGQDVAKVVFWLKELKENGEGVEGVYTHTGFTPLLVATSKEESRISSLIIALLRCAGCSIPDPADSGAIDQVMQSWVFDAFAGDEGANRADAEARHLLSLNYLDVQNWIAAYLPPQEPFGREDSSFLQEERNREASLAPVIPEVVDPAAILPFSLQYRGRPFTSPSLTPAPARHPAIFSSPSPTPIPGYTDFDSTPIILTDSDSDSRSPSPKVEVDADDGIFPADKTTNEPHPPASLRIDNIPPLTTTDALLDLFGPRSGVVDAHVLVGETGIPFGFVGFKSVELAHLASIKAQKVRLEGKLLEFSLYDEGLGLVGILREATPVAEDPDGRSPFAEGGARGAGGRGGRRPPVPLLFRADVLRARCYFGSLPHGMTRDQLNGHLLWVTPVHEGGHSWTHSFAVKGFPEWFRYRDVSDFLMARISDFSSLTVTIIHPSLSASATRAEHSVFARVEVRYTTELHWACEQLDGLIVEGRRLEVRIQQDGWRGTGGGRRGGLGGGGGYPAGMRQEARIAPEDRRIGFGDHDREVPRGEEGAMVLDEVS
ncbi:hypothetical protein JCM11641_004780 [Rhodosporidiobolus odoratus]